MPEFQSLQVGWAGKRRSYLGHYRCGTKVGPGFRRESRGLVAQLGEV